MKRDEISYYVLVVFAALCLVAALIANAVNGADEEPEAVVVPDIEAETEAQVETVPADTIFAPITEAETEAETKTAIPDTAEQAPKTDEEIKTYTDEDLLFLAKIVQNEAGSDYCTDEHQQYVASVVLNRVNSPRFPGDTILEIALCGYGDGQPIQYMYSLDPNEGEAAFWNIKPSERAIQNARYVLENGVLDESVVWQANCEQGCEVVKKFTYEFANPPTTYICR